MSTSSDNNNGKFWLYLLLGVAGLWLAWQVLKFVYYSLCYLGANAYLALDLSAYGQLNDNYWPGYALLGLVLGAAGGAAAAQRRFGLDRRIMGGALLLVVLVAVVGYLGAASTPDFDQITSESRPTTQEQQAVCATTAAPEARAPLATDVDGVVINTASPAITTDEWLQTSEAVPLWVNPSDSAEPAPLQLQAREVVHVVRRIGPWARVLTGGRNRSPQDPTGWVRAAGLLPLPEAAEAAAPNDQPAALSITTENASASPENEAAAVEAPTNTFPTGHQQHTGQINNLNVTYSLDWQPTGELSGSYFYDQQPSTTYRLTGAVAANGELHLLEFTRGQQSARCTLLWQEAGYVGTMFSADGQQMAMSLH